MVEEWRRIDGFPHYEVSNSGKIRRTHLGSKISPESASQIKALYGTMMLKDIAAIFGVTPRAITVCATYEPKRGSHREPNRVLKSQNTNGYACVMMCEQGRARYRAIHIMVAAAFLPPKPTSSHEVNHKNGNKMDPREDNLEWVTRSENMIHFHRETKPTLGIIDTPNSLKESKLQ